MTIDARGGAERRPPSTPAPADASADARLASADRRGDGLLVPVAGIALLLAISARFSYLGQAFANDPGLYAAMGKAVVEGRQLYVDIWDTKPPGITLLTAPLYAALRNHWWAWIVAQCLMVFAAVGVLARAASLAVPSDGDPRPTRRATWAVGLTLLNLHWMLESGFQLESAMATFACAAGCAVVASIRAASARSATLLALVAGLAGGAAATMKPTSLAVIAAAGVALLEIARRGDLARAVRLGAAIAVGLIVMAGVNVAWYAYLGVWPYLGDVFREIKLYGSGTPWSQILTPKTVVLIALLSWPAALLMATSRWTSRRPAARREGDASAAVVWTFAVAWLAIEVVGTISQKRGYAYHFLPIAAPATLLAGLAFARGLTVRAGTIAVVAALVPLFALSMFSAAGQWERFVARGGTSAGASLIAYLRDRTEPTDAIFGDPVGELSVLADRRAGARVGQLISFVNHDDAPRKFSEQVIADLDERRCAVIVLPKPEVLASRIATWETQPVLARHPARLAAYRAAWARFLAYVHDHYTLERSDLDGRDVWRRKP